MKKLNLLISVFMLLFAFGIVTGQETVTIEGFVIGDDMETPLENVLVSAYSVEYSDLYVDVLTDINGAFEIEITYPSDFTEDQVFIDVMDDCGEIFTEVLDVSTDDNFFTDIYFFVCMNSDCAVDFIWFPQSYNYQSVIFYAFTENPDDVEIWSWNFGDGNTGEYSQTSNYYETDGTYLVTLTAEFMDGMCEGQIATSEQEIYIENPFPDEECFADFYYETADFYTFNFIDFSWVQMEDYVMTYEWDFGDGATSTEPYPTHTYTANGEYLVSLTINTSLGCSSTWDEMVWVGEDPWYPEECEAFFFTEYTDEPNTVFFENISWGGGEPITSYIWDFGDGSNSTVANPTHTYEEEGEYFVSLTISTQGGCSSTLEIFVYVDSENTTSGILFFPEYVEGTKGHTAGFNNLSGDGAWDWNYGDAKKYSTNSKEYNEHTFESAGVYLVTLTRSNTGEAFAIRLRIDDAKNTKEAGLQILEAYAYNGDQSTKIESIEESDSNISIYPNPVVDKLNIMTEETASEVNVSVMNIAGQIVFEGSYSETDKIEINTSELPKGVYLSKIIVDGIETNMKFVK